MCAWLVIRGDGEVDCDAFCLRSNAAGSEYVPTGNYRKLFKAVDIPELTADQQAIEATYGYREPDEDVVQDIIIDDTDGYAFALRLFAQRALPVEDMDSIEWREPDRLIMPGVRVALYDEVGNSLLSVPQRYDSGRLRWPVNGQAVLSISSGEPRRDPVRLFLERDKRIERRARSSASSI